MSTRWQERKIALQKNRILLLKLASLFTTELQPCEGENRGGQSDITQTHTHTQKVKKENPLMGEMREGVGSVTAWLEDEGQLQ